MNSLFLCCSHSNGAHNRQINENPIPPKIHIFKNMSLFFLKPGKELGMVVEVTKEELVEFVYPATKQYKL